MVPLDVRARYPEFDATTYPDARVQIALDDAGALIGPRWGTLASQGQAALAAHYLATAQARIAAAGGAGGTTTTTVNGVGVATGAIKAMTVGDVSVQYETGGTSSSTTTSSRAASAQQQYGTTPYGLRYLELLALLGPAVMVV